MSKIKYILFDCMETVIDIIENPDIRLYAWWAYNGSGYEYLWENFGSFSSHYSTVKAQIENKKNQLEEYNTFERFNLMAKNKITDVIKAKEAVNAISNNYWKNYKANCYVDSKVKSTLSHVCSKFKCGIVSNFMVPRGIEELLKDFGIYDHFDFVISSIDVGWRKPHKKIFDKVIEISGGSVEQMLFVGDNYICDYVGPLNYGFDAILLDKVNIHSKANKRINRLEDLLTYIE